MTRRELLAAVPFLQEGNRFSFGDETFPCAGTFDYREVVASAPARTGNWAVKHAQLPGGQIAMVWCSTAGSEVSRTNRIWISRSADEGESWSEPEVVSTAGAEVSVLNPALYTHTDGRVHLFHNAGDGYVRYDLVQRTSTDAGRTWSAPRVLSLGDTVVSSVMSNPIRLRTGVILLPVSFSRTRQRRNHYIATVMLSSDGGESWKQGGEMHVETERGAMEPTIAELSNGELLCLMRTKAGFQYESRSGDGGLSWSAPRPSIFAGPESTGILLRLASGALLFAWNGHGLSGGKQVPRYPMTLALSADDGRTWPWRRVVETASGDHQLSNHGLFQTASGRILLAMEHFLGIRDGRELGPIEQARFDEAWIKSRVSPDRWEEAPAPTGAIRLASTGVTLISGASSEETTMLKSRIALPASGKIEIEVGGVEGTLGDGAGIYFGPSPFGGAVTPLHRGKQIVEVRRPGEWGFYARNDGAQVRLTIRGVRMV